MKLKLLLSIFIFIGSYTFIYSQDDIQIGNPSGNLNSRYNGGLYDFSDPNKVNIKVQLWGYVRFPGYYILPAGISVNELISFAGGPTEDAILEDIRVTKIKPGAKTIMFKYNYNDLMWSDNLDTQINYVPIEAGDIVVIPGEPRYFGRENFQFFFSIFSTLATLAILIYSITK
jgi:protein involved in polysaccharide export with SLBB domain